MMWHTVAHRRKEAMKQGLPHLLAETKESSL